MLGMWGMQGIRVGMLGMWGMQGIRVGMLGMWGMQGIRVGMQYFTIQLLWAAPRLLGTSFLSTKWMSSPSRK